MPLREVFTLSDEANLDRLEMLMVEDSDMEFWKTLCARESLDYDTLKIWSEGRKIKFSAESLPVSHE